MDTNTDLRSMTGSGTFSYEFARYEQTPSDIQEKEIAERAGKLDNTDNSQFLKETVLPESRIKTQTGCNIFGVCN